MGVQLQSEGFGSMTESSRDNVVWFARLQPKGRLGVSEVVETDPSKPYLFHDAIEPTRDDIGVKEVRGGFLVGCC
jgi:hypothetical protein